jgi:hypothetical protein
LLADTSGDDVLKKTGIVVAAVATGLIGLSPLAFAEDWGHHRGADKVEISEDNDTRTFEDNSINREQYNRCVFIQDQDASATGGLLDPLPVPAPVPGPVDLPTLGAQTQDANCTNVGDTTGAALPLGPVIP